MFRFIHCYDPDFVRGLMLTGLCNDADGFKVLQHCLTPEERKFNQFAAPGTLLYDLLHERKTVFYIDRLHGGTFYSHYNFDPSLVAAYEDMLGDGFLGMQVHESGVVRLLDWQRIRKQMKSAPPWTAKQIYEGVREVSCNKQHIHLSCGSAEEYSRATPPETVSAYFADLNNLLALRQRETSGHVLMCDSCMMPSYLEKANHIRNSMVELGAQTPHARVQIALRRGVSRAAGQPWGVYFEPWGGTPLSSYMYRLDGGNEWGITRNNFSYFSKGKQGGSSHSLQRRIFFYSLFSGASYLSEEWGQSNTFYDWKDFTLSPYGEVKREFRNYAARLPNIEPLVPFALVIPHELQIFTVSRMYAENVYLDLNADFDMRLCRNAINAIYELYDAVSPKAAEDQILTNSRIGSLFDIVYDDCDTEALDRYDLLIDFSGRLKGERVYPYTDMMSLTEKLLTAADTWLPFTYECSAPVDYLLFDEGGHHYIALFNHAGLSRSEDEGETVRADATLTITINFKEGYAPVSCEAFDNIAEIGNNVCRLRLSGGTFTLLTYEHTTLYCSI